MAGALHSPLKGLRIVEILGGALPLHLQCAIAMAGKIASELGAEVRVVRHGDESVFADHPDNSDCRALRAFLYDGKTLLRCDDAGSIDEADAILTDPSVLLPENKTAVVISDFGANARLRHTKSSELTILAMSGLLHVMGLQAGRPVRLPGHQPAYAAGLAAYLALIAGLVSRTPRVADVSMLDAMLWVDWKLPAVAMLSPNATPAQGGEWQAVATKDGHVAFVYQERDWPAVVDLLNIDALHDNRFASRRTRIAHYDSMMDIIRPWFAERTKQEIYTLAKQKGIPLGPVWTVDDLRRDAQYLERDFLRFLPHGGFMPRLPLMWNGLRPGVPMRHVTMPADEMLNV